MEIAEIAELSGYEEEVEVASKINEIIKSVRNVNTILNTIYSIGALYITTSNSETCPIASLISGSRWQKVASGRVLQGADEIHEAGTTIAAGLPNITGFSGGWGGVLSHAGGACYLSGGGTAVAGNGSYGAGNSTTNIDASLSNSVYGNSDTVQPPAYCVNIWRRIA